MKHGRQNNRRPQPSTTTTLFTILIALAMVTFPIASALGVTISDPIGSTWEQTAHITPDDSDEPAWNGHPSHTGVKFGASISVDDDKLIVGTTYGMTDSFNWAYIFEQDEGGDWQQIAKLDDGLEYSAFGHDVDIDSEEGVAVVGAPRYDRDGPETADDEDGVVFVYEETSDGSWELESELQGAADGERPLGALFGFSVVIHEGIVGVAAPTESTEAGRLAGAVHLFEQDNNGEWERTHHIVPEDQDPLGRFGGTYDAVDMVDGALVAAAPSERQEDDGWGAVYIFEENHGIWEQAQRIVSPDGPSGCLGATLDLDIDHLVLGDLCRPNWLDRELPWGPSNPEGAAFVYERDETGWKFQAELKGSESGAFLHNRFADDVEIAGDVIAVGASWDPEKRIQMGVVYLFEFDGDEWVEKGQIKAEETFSEDRFGWRVDFQDPQTLFVAAPGDNNRQDGWPHPTGEPRAPLIQGPDGWNAGSVFQFTSAEGISPNR